MRCSPTRSCSTAASAGSRAATASTSRPGGIAYTHTHPGPGIRYLLEGTLRIESEGETTDYAAGEPWFERGPDPVLATAAVDRDSAFVRVLLLPDEWAGKRTIRYVDPADDEKPRLQRPTVFFDRPITLP